MKIANFEAIAPVMKTFATEDGIAVGALEKKRKQYTFRMSGVVVVEVTFEGDKPTPAAGSYAIDTDSGSVTLLEATPKPVKAETSRNTANGCSVSGLNQNAAYQQLFQR